MYHQLLDDRFARGMKLCMSSNKSSKRFNPVPSIYLQSKYVGCINFTIKQQVYKRLSLRTAKVTVAIVVV